MTDTRRVLDIMLEMYPRLENFVHLKNHVSVRWLKRLGFSFDEPIVLPQSGEEFVRFHMEKRNV